MRFSANLGYLWRGQALEERIDRAAAAGFDAVEFHDEPQSADTGRLADRLARLRLPVESLNTCMGDGAGCAALPGKAAQARADIEAAAAAARRLQARAIHVLAGCGAGDMETYLGSLSHALAVWDGVVLIEPISPAGLPGYWMNALDRVTAVLAALPDPRLRLMLDGFHMAALGHDLVAVHRRHAARVGHVQIAAYPDRGEPDTPRPDYARLLPALRRDGYTGSFGAEYRPRATVEDGLGWMARLRRAG